MSLANCTMKTKMLAIASFYISISDFAFISLTIANTQIIYGRSTDRSPGVSAQAHQLDLLARRIELNDRVR